MMQMFEKLVAENQDENNCFHFMEKCMLVVNGVARDYEKTEICEDEYNMKKYIKWFRSVCNPSNGPVFISIANSSGCDRTFDHSFTLFQNSGKTYSAECYVNEYKARIIEWPAWQKDIENLLRTPPGKNRVGLYNEIFGVNENVNCDTEFEMDIEIHH